LERPGVTPSAILTGAKRYRNDRIKRGKMEYYKHAQGWLNGDMWESQNTLPLEPVRKPFNGAVF